MSMLDEGPSPDLQDDEFSHLLVAFGVSTRRLLIASTGTLESRRTPESTLCILIVASKSHDRLRLIDIFKRKRLIDCMNKRVKREVRM